MKNKYDNKVVKSYIPNIDNRKIISKRNRLISKAPWPFNKMFSPLDDLKINIRG